MDASQRTLGDLDLRLAKVERDARALLPGVDVDFGGERALERVEHGVLHAELAVRLDRLQVLAANDDRSGGRHSRAINVELLIILRLVVELDLDAHALSAVV